MSKQRRVYPGSKSCMCDWPSGCGGSGVLQCKGCGGDQCVCLCGGEDECDGCDMCDGMDDAPDSWEACDDPLGPMDEGA